VLGFTPTLGQVRVATKHVKGKFIHGTFQQFKLEVMTTTPTIFTPFKNDVLEGS
jgi:hypothetical protein